MNRYTAFLRAVNVGGHGIVKMEALREMFNSLGLKDVSTYIQSGNVIFSSASKNVSALNKKIEKLLTEQLNYEVKCFLRSVSQIEEIIKNNPFDEGSVNKNLVLYLAFVEKPPGSEVIEEFKYYNSDNESFKIIGSEVYCLIRKDVPKIIFSGNWLEKKLKMSATVRNWNTIKKMYSLLLVQ